MEKWSGDGNLDWENDTTGDKISSRKEDGLVIVDLKKLCTHADGAYCCFCVSRLLKLAEIAERSLRVGSSAHAVEQEKQAGQFPEQLALVNAIQKQAFCMKLNIVWKVTGSKTILGRAKGETLDIQKLFVALEYKTFSRVSDAQYIRGFRVRLGEDTPEDHAKRLWGCPSSLVIDGNSLTEAIPLKDLLSRNEVLFERKREVNLFHAHAVRNPTSDGMGEVHSSDWVGYMVPNGSCIQFIMEDVPVLDGPVKVEVEFDLVSYTTRGFAHEKLER
jgi:hypothetical protein